MNPTCMLHSFRRRRGPGSAFGTVACRALPLFEVVRGVDERDVGEGLREVAEHALVACVVLLREEPLVVAGREHPIESRAGLIEASLPGQALGEPERAGEERSLSTADAVETKNSIGKRAPMTRLNFFIVGAPSVKIENIPKTPEKIT